MAFQFPATQYYRVFRAGESIIKGGSFNLSEAMNLKHAVTSIYIKGTRGGSEQIRMEIYPTDASNTAIYTSDWFSLSQCGNNWLGNVRLDFSPEKPLNPNIDYFFRFRIQNYTANPDTFYVAMNLDWVDRVNEAPNADEAGVRMRLVGLKDVD